MRMQFSANRRIEGGLSAGVTYATFSADSLQDVLFLKNLMDSLKKIDSTKWDKIIFQLPEENLKNLK